MNQRIVKFRAWDERLKEMLYPTKRNTLLGFLGLPHVMQFTGLLDKNGKEIYEGDLFGLFGGDKERPDDYEVHGTVYFDRDLSAFCVDEPNGGWRYLHEYLDLPKKGQEVIGNVYEHKHLLKEHGSQQDT